MYTIALATAVTGSGAQTAQTPGNTFPGFAFRDKVTASFIVTGGTSRSVQVEGSPDGTNWIVLGTAVTTTGNSFQELSRFPFYRANITANVGTTISVFLTV